MSTFNVGKLNNLIFTDKLKLGVYTESQRDSATDAGEFVAGAVIINSTEPSVQFFDGGAWTSI